MEDETQDDGGGLTHRALLASIIAAGTVSLTGCSKGQVPAAEDGNVSSSDGGSGNSASTVDTSDDSGDPLDYDDVDVEVASEDEVRAILSGTGDGFLLDARPQEAYAGWALEGARRGGHLVGAGLLSARWFDCKFLVMGTRWGYVERALRDQGVSSGSGVIVYDYDGSQALPVARFLKSRMGYSDVKIFKANELIDSDEEGILEFYENFDFFVPPEIVKSVSDVKCGKAALLSNDARALLGDDPSKVILIDISRGNAKESLYLSDGHVPGAIHINSEAYDRPRVYVPEKRSAYVLEYRKIPIEEFQQSVCPRYGITRDSICILTGNTLAAQGRMGFYLRSCGVRTYAMSGGLICWDYAGYELDHDLSTIVAPTATESFGSTEVHNSEYDTEDIEAIQAGELDAQIVDERDEACWSGEYSGYSFHDISGHVEGAVRCQGASTEDGEYFCNVDDTPRTRGEYVCYLESCGLDVSRPMIFYCGDSWGGSMIAYWCQSADLANVNVWSQGWIPWSNDGHPFIDHEGRRVHYDRYLDTVLDEEGNDVRDGVNIRNDPPSDD